MGSDMALMRLVEPGCQVGRPIGLATLAGVDAQPALQHVRIDGLREVAVEVGRALRDVAGIGIPARQRRERRRFGREAFAQLAALGAYARERLAEASAGLPLQVTGAGSLFKITATPRRLREIASESFHREEIDADTYRELSTELPLQTVDRNGNILDLSTLTDDSDFDYAEYYRTQQSLAEMIGDMDMADSYAKVLDFFAKTT